MKNILLVFLFLSLLIVILASCGEKRNPYKDLNLPDNKEYNQVIIEILKQDTQELFRSKFICADLVKQQIDLTRSRTEIQGDNKVISINPFYTYMNSDSIYDKSDSLYFAFQNDSAKQISIDKTVADFANLMTSELIAENKKTKEYFGYFQFSLPIFNESISKAYVQSDYQCKGCGYGKLYVLKKINNKWIIVYSDITWMN